MKKLPKLGCACEQHDLLESEYRTSTVGNDISDGGNAEVSIIQCKLCQRIWLKYELNFAENSDKNRWFKGIIAKKEVAEMKPENAVPYLESLSWYICGGNYFNNEATFKSGTLELPEI